MKRILLLLIITGSLAGCQKKDSTVNNYTTVGSSQPAFAVNGISDLTFINDVDYSDALTLTVQYLDSAQENVTLAVTGLPAGVTIDSTWTSSGIPTFSTTLTIIDSSAVGITPGTYPVALTATTASGKVKTYPFNVKVLPMPTAFLGKYNNCYNTCTGGVNYTDSVYADPSVQNKVWFTNFANSGTRIYALISDPETITIPEQTFNGNTYSGTANLYLEEHQITIAIHSTASNCTVNMH